MAGRATDADLAALAETKLGEHDYGKSHPSDEKFAESSVDNHTDNHTIDDAHEGLEFPTEEERHTLRRVSDAIPWNAYRKSNLYIPRTCVNESPLVIATIELAERFSYYGSTVVFVSACRRKKKFWALSYAFFRPILSSNLFQLAHGLVLVVVTLANPVLSVKVNKPHSVLPHSSSFGHT